MAKSIIRWVGILFFTIFVGLIASSRLYVKAQAASVQYRAHVQAEGWQRYVKDGASAGTVGKSHAMEAVRIKLQGVSGGIKYQSHLRNVGWTAWVSNDAQSGTTGQSRMMEAIRINLTGVAAKAYDVYYRVHVGEYGWLGWTKNGEIAGSVGCSMRMEAIQVKLCAKNKKVATSKSYITRPSLAVQSHVGNVGWQKAAADGIISGTVGRSLRMEAMIIRCTDFLGGNGIQYRAHVQNVGWQGWCNSGSVSGTTGKSLQMEAMQIRLVGNIALPFDVYYRVHVGGIGWLGWAKNGASAGTTGGSKRIEAIQVKLVRKGDGFVTGGAAYRDYSPSENPNFPTQIARITANGQTVDAFNGVPAKYITGLHNSDQGIYCCAGYVSSYYSRVYGVSVWNMFTNATPSASSGYFYQTKSPKAGDIGYQLNSGGRGHWFIIKSVNCDGTYTVIEQNWKWMSGNATYCNVNRKVSYKLTRGFKVFRWSKRTN